MASPAKPAQGQCAQCGAANPYTETKCRDCGARLPWADAIAQSKEKARGAGSMFVITGCMVLTGLAMTALIILYSLVAAGILKLPGSGAAG